MEHRVACKYNQSPQANAGHPRPSRHITPAPLVLACFHLSWNRFSTIEMSPMRGMYQSLPPSSSFISPTVLRQESTTAVSCPWSSHAHAPSESQNDPFVINEHLLHSGSHGSQKPQVPNQVIHNHGSVGFNHLNNNHDHEMAVHIKKTWRSDYSTLSSSCYSAPLPRYNHLPTW